MAAAAARTCACCCRAGQDWRATSNSVQQRQLGSSYTPSAAAPTTRGGSSGGRVPLALHLRQVATSARPERGSSGPSSDPDSWSDGSSSRSSSSRASRDSSATERSSSSRSSGSKQRRPRALRREDLPFFIARSDLTWEQPWRFQQSAPLSQLQLRAQGVAGLDDEAAAQPDREHASTSFTVQLPLGLGALVVTGSVSASVPVRCEFCGDGFEVGVEQEQFDAVIHLTPSSGAGLELAANELTFGDEENLCDITPLVVDAIVTALPTVCLCGGGSCRQHAGREVVWSSSTPAAASGSVASPAANSPFAKLLKKKK